MSVAAGFTAPTAMAIAPDGRVFVAEQGGRLRVVKDGALLATPFVERDGELRPASAGCSASPSIRTSPPTASSTSTTRAHVADGAQPRQPLHRQRGEPDVAVPGSEV